METFIFSKGIFTKSERKKLFRWWLVVLFSTHKQEAASANGLILKRYIKLGLIYQFSMVLRSLRINFFERRYNDWITRISNVIFEQATVSHADLSFSNLYLFCMLSYITKSLHKCLQKTAELQCYKCPTLLCVQNTNFVVIVLLSHPRQRRLNIRHLSQYAPGSKILPKNFRYRAITAVKISPIIR